MSIETEISALKYKVNKILEEKKYVFYMNTGSLTGDLTVGGNIIGWGNKIVRPYGSFYDTTTQTASATPNTALAMKLNTTDIAIGVSIVSGSRIQFNYDGIYNIEFSAQFDKTDAGTDDVEVWLSYTGSNVPWSNTQISLVGNNAKAVAAWNWFVSASAGEYCEIMWYSADTNLRILSQGTQSAPVRPEIPSVIVTVTQV